MSEKRQKKKVIKTPSNEPDIQVDFTEIQLFFLAFFPWSSSDIQYMIQKK